MTRYVMVADLRRCVGCQTCTAACKENNGTPVGVQWRRVLDIEAGEYPDVSRVFLPTGCNHCDKPPCMEVCPSTATGKRADGLVTIDYDLCIGCSYCIMACPYDARFKVEDLAYSYGEANAADQARSNPAEFDGVVSKCTFCIDRIDAGLAKGLVPGRDMEATPACVQGCISGALRFGDLHDPDSDVSQLIKTNKYFRQHEEEGTGPGFYYLWDKGAP
ncbi:Phenylacetyl-CoA:acceptor oxidoreductase [Magnetospirillum sp. LM-5]|uniref:4Fe-4S dicluster domain-containing protein n=1 Tax=Magnetospirillum sp. LM-5 TaxID=2681466 RepID=UPI00137D4D22|nr:4Fe-4S dicluster domain-containing protein [Magnetospirillum sp. LM-5]CAA7625373.1 Phenylacetyl-CoA:acceptor oxidoreductase [Magnetospirillum sp. LM-5]